MLNDSDKIQRVEKLCLNLNLRMFLKVQGGLKEKIEKIWSFRDSLDTIYIYDTKEENLSSIFPE